MILSIGTAFLFLNNPSPAHAQSAPQPIEAKEFPETGHTIQGEFLKFYERTPDAPNLYGYPITEEFIDPVYGRLVQYFQKARFELFPNEPPELRVRLSHLGEWLYEPGQLLTQAVNSPGCRTFYSINKAQSGAGLKVCYAFLDFFDAHGGFRQFGNPISNLENHDGRYVQYFQKARFEWHPEFPSGQRVHLANLGSIYFQQQAVDQSYLRQGDNLPQTILHLNMRCYPQQAVTKLRGRQYIYIIVQDQNLLPVANAKISLRFRSPLDKESDLGLQVETDQNGLAAFALPFETDQPGLFTVVTNARLGDLQNQGVCSFRAWW